MTPERALWMVGSCGVPAWQSVRMTDRPPNAEAQGLRRWPTDPAQLVDTTRCPACFSPLETTRCDVCGLEVGVPASGELFRLSSAVYEGERARQALIDRMRAEQAAREAVSRAFPDVAGPAIGAVAVHAAPPAPAPMPSPPSPPAPSAASIPPVAPERPAEIPPPAAAPPVAVPAAALPAPERRRSGVQVLLLTLGVVLISVTAIVFLFVAYLVASLEVRSVIIGAASVLVLGVAWLLRARRLPGTAEGVAAVAVVLLLLDVWIVRANDLFGTDALETAAYTGGAFAVVAALLAATRVTSGIRIPGFAAAALAPASAFLLAYAIDPETATGIWLGGLAAVLVGAVGAFGPRSPERAIMLSAALGGAATALVAAPWALPDQPWNEAWAFLAVAAASIALIAALHVSRADAAPAWSRVAAVGAGIAAGLGPAVGIAAELDPGESIWLAPAAAGAAAAVFAAVTRWGGAIRLDGRAALIAAGAVGIVAAAPGFFVGSAAIVARLAASVPAWSVDDGRVAWTDPVLDLGTALVPFVVAAGTLGILLILGAAHRFAAIPVALTMGGVLVVGAIIPGAAVPVAVFAAIGAAALGTAAIRASAPALLPVLVTFGMSGSALAIWTGWSNAGTWPWAIAAVLATAVAGRLLARRVWTSGSWSALGAAHLGIAVVLTAAAAFTMPAWMAASQVAVPSPWTSPWLWLGTVAAVLLTAALLIPRLGDADRIALVTPALLAATSGALLTAALGSTVLGWLPAAIAAIAVASTIRIAAPSLVRQLLAAAGPVLLATTFERVLAAIPEAPSSVLGAAAGVLAAAAIAPLVLPRDRGPRIAWRVSVAVAGLVTLAAVGTAGDQAWLLLLLLAPVPIIVAWIDGDPIGGSADSRHLSWLSLALAVASVWTRLSGEGVDDVEAYTLPLAAALAVGAGLVTWRRPSESTPAAGRTALFAAAAAVAVLPSVASSAESELRTLILVAAGSIVALAAAFLPDEARGVPVRLLGIATGWVALTGAALVRGCAVAIGAPSDLLVEFWPGLALVAGVAVAVIWARTASRPAPIAEALLGASVVAASVPTVLAIVSGDRPTLRAAVLFPVLAVAHVAGAATTARPFAGPVLAWSTLGVLVLGGAAVLFPGDVEPFDLVTVPIGAALIGAGAIRMSRSPALGSWPALGPGLAVLLLPALLADFTDPELWRLIALGVVAALAVVVGAVRRLQAPLLLGGAVLLVHAIAQLWPWITWLYEAVWWWLWLGVAGVILVALAATYERQLRLARGVVRTITDLR